MNYKSNFYNTAGLTGQALKKATEKIKAQNLRVLKIFQLSGKPLTPSEVHVIYCDIYPPSPITSIRRAISDFTDEGLLIKTSVQREGRYGKPNHLWKINPDDDRNKAYIKA